MNQKIITLTLIITGFLSLILDDYLLKLIPIIRLEQLNTTFIFFGSKFGLLLIGLIILTISCIYLFYLLWNAINEKIIQILYKIEIN